MNVFTRKRFFQALLFGASLCATVVAQAHLMKAQHGTLNFKDDGVYMVLSLPASAFGEADENNDKLLSSDEFSKNRFGMTEMIQRAVTLNSKYNDLMLEGIMLKLDTPHDSPKSPAPNVVVLGKFFLPNDKSALEFDINLFDSDQENHSIEITASRKSEGLKQVFEISSNTPRVKLNFN